MIGVGAMVAYIIEFFVALIIVNAMFFASIALINMAWTGSRYLYRRIREWSREQTPYEWWRSHHHIPGQV
jgi:cation transport ATPase